jgi:hypothetical protein
MFLCHCVRNTCLHLEMKRTRQHRETHRTRKENCLRKEKAKYKDGLGKYRVTVSQMNAKARSEKIPAWMESPYALETAA